MKKFTQMVRYTVTRAGLGVAGLLALSLVHVACSGGAATGQVDPTRPPDAENVAAAINVVETFTPEALPQVMSQGQQLQPLDADAIVAAQEEVLTGIYERLVPSVVQIRTVRKMREMPDFPNQPETPGLPFNRSPDSPQPPDKRFSRGGGSGFVWDQQGRVVTNHHVVEGADRIIVTLFDRSEVEAEILGTDPDSDLAVLQIEIPDGLQLNPVQLGDSESLRVGQMAAAIGNPFGQEFTITSGIISAVGRTIRSGNSQFSIPEVVQTDASINPGNSGGPLLDRRGRVVGVNTQIISESGTNSGIGFAVPIDIAKRVVPALIEDGNYEYAWLGISGTTLRPDIAELMNLPRTNRGALVIEVAHEGPAERAGLKGSGGTASVDGVDVPLGGDIIVGINGTRIMDMDSLISYLVSENQPGDKAVLEILREGSQEEIEVTLGERPS